MNYEGFTVAIPNYTSLSPMLEQLNRSFKRRAINMNELTVYHFMSDKLNLYSDIGNIIALKQRAKKRGIQLNVVEVNQTEGVTLDNCDIFFIGGGSDREQSIATKELSKIKTT